MPRDCRIAWVVCGQRSQTSRARSRRRGGRSLTASRPSAGPAACTRARRPRSARGCSMRRRRCRIAVGLGPGERNATTPGLAGIAGYARQELEALDARGQRAARLEIDRELAARKGASVAAREVAAAGEGSLKPREQKTDGQAVRRFARAAGEGGRPRAAFIAQTTAETPSFETTAGMARAGRSNGARPVAGRRESSVMRDAHEVAAGRKRQLGREQRR